MTRIHNFSAGPAVLPETVLKQTAQAIIEYGDTGIGVLELSHRSRPFEAILESLQSRLRDLLNIPLNYQILVCTGGATQQFSMVPLNLLSRSKVGAYILSGSWSIKAEEEARKFGNTEIVGSSKANNFCSIPEINLPKNNQSLAYVHFTSNNTIFGTQYTTEPEVEGVPLVCDASSDLLHRQIDVSKYGLIYASTQKNLGPAGATLVIIREDLLERCQPNLPIMLNYRTYSENQSLYNTPPTGVVYMVDQVLGWIQSIGGLAEIEARNRRKAALIYDVIDSSDLYVGHAESASRSLMNITFTLRQPNLDQDFLKQAEERGLSGLKGHRSVGGFRASMYNALPETSALELAEFMKEFANQAG